MNSNEVFQKQEIVRWFDAHSRPKISPVIWFKCVSLKSLFIQLKKEKQYEREEQHSLNFLEKCLDNGVHYCIF